MAGAVAAAAGTVEITTAASAARATNTVRGVRRMPRHRPAVEWPDLTVRRNAPPGRGTDAAVTWSVCVRDAGGEVVHAHRPDLVLSTASVGKLLLLLEVARSLPLDLPCDRRDVAPVADSGLWRFLGTDVLPVEDLAVLVASVSDNLATNVLLHRVGLDRVAALAASLGLTATALHDVVRDVRTADHAPRLSSGSAAELSLLLHRLPSVEGGPRVLDWMRTSADLSMVASAFDLDPLSHNGGVVRNKTGTDDGVRVDVGVVTGPSMTVSYAVLANWPPASATVGDVLATMRALGDAIRVTVGK
ncbi:serine hydrolase [Dactylosporangium siamense]|uniref:Serine hydrolase n=2 Tax=Dactylosporangium siamense TaxID=685454 RepID=A0A919PVN1_9ACTN|nr:serine hydrolase [Dactylosporangium siamense]